MGQHFSVILCNWRLLAMIITIARECGCYGDLIGEKLGEKLGIPVYDKKSVTQMAKEAGIYSKYPNFFSEKQANEFLAAIISDECETVKDTPQKALSAVITDESSSSMSLAS